MNKSAVRIRIRQMCCLGLGEEILATALVPAIRELVQGDSSAVAWVDGSGTITNVYSDRLSSMQMVASMPAARASRCESRSSIQSLEAETCQGRSRVLRVVVEDVEGQAAQVSICRPLQRSPFHEDEIAELSSVMHYIAHGMSRGRAAGSLRHLEFTDSPEEALVVTDRGGSLRQATEEGRRMLLLAAGCKIDRMTLDAVSSIVSNLLGTVCEQAGVAAAFGPIPLAATTSTGWGRFVLTAYPLLNARSRKNGLIGIRIQRQEPAMIHVVRAISRLDLSPQQRQIALHIAQGASNREIASSLRVSCNTVAYHVRQLFMKLGVHDRASLLGRIGAGSTVQVARAV